MVFPDSASNLNADLLINQCFLKLIKFFKIYAVLHDQMMKNCYVLLASLMVCPYVHASNRKTTRETGGSQGEFIACYMGNFMVK